MAIVLRDATAFDADNVQVLLFDHGPNPWNWLPAEGVAQTLQQLVAGLCRGVLAEDGTVLVGAVLYRRADPYPSLRPDDVASAQCGYIVEAVVHRDYAGQGIGARLLQAACQQLASDGLRWVVADRHEENGPSAGMMRKAGFSQLGVYEDPARRPSGSGRTAVCGRYL
ncbi:GNAT family N-acetyltransferase [Vogesella sp. DC21W]|uniref:GNAT family N-acetyltransferase n=1 Tax=Vogesella aquatica TaxID=2984206 RepID=A0ABT5ITI4_9NEIS|nr:GNAT family N-acetyltransferase [Vogesella aquatica]MDC7715889.1 GNAT family N-acetyltransferase [Vogesella aquatica]